MATATAQVVVSAPAAPASTATATATVVVSATPPPAASTATATATVVVSTLPSYGLYLRTGNTLKPVRLGIRTGSSITWLSPALPVAAPSGTYTSTYGATY